MPGGLLSLLMVVAAAPVTVLSGSTPEPVALLLLSPTGERGRVSRSDAIRTVEASLLRRTELSPTAVDPRIGADCRGKTNCIIRGLPPGDDGPVGWLLIVTLVSLEGSPDRASLVLIRLPRALPIDDDALEIALDGASHRATPSDISSSEAFARFVDAAIDGPLSAVLEQERAQRASGEVLLSRVPLGAVILVDGRPVGTAATADIRIERLRPGPHRIEVAPSTGPTWRSELEVGVGRVAPTVEVALDLDPRSRANRIGVGIGGGALALGGAALVAVAAAIERPVASACFSSVPGCESGTSFVRSGYDPSAPLSADVNRYGVPLVPLGAALAVTGAGIALGAWLEDRDIPWWSVGISTLAGAAVFGAAALAESGRMP